MARRTDFEREQQESFVAYEEKAGEGLAFFYNCIKYNMPFRYEAIPDNRETNKWYGYLDGLDELEVDLETETFFDGEVDPSGLLQDKEDDEGTKHERQERVWGAKFSQEDYDRLDELFDTFSARLRESGGYDDQQEYTLQICSRMQLKVEKYLEQDTKESIAMAKDLQKMIQDNLASENLRKKDILPTSVHRPDGIVDALERKFGKGIDLTQNDVLEIFHKWQKRQHFPMTKDAADQMLLLIVNTMNRNNNMPELAELPEGIEVVDELGSFEKVRSQEEKEVYEYLNLSDMVRKPKDGGDA